MHSSSSKAIGVPRRLPQLRLHLPISLLHMTPPSAPWAGDFLLTAAVFDFQCAFVELYTYGVALLQRLLQLPLWRFPLLPRDFVSIFQSPPCTGPRFVVTVP